MGASEESPQRAQRTAILAGLAIAVGEVVDDAIIDVENIVRRLRENRTLPSPLSAFQVVDRASLEVRSAVVFASLIVVCVCLPIFFMGGVAGSFFRPLAVAYILAILLAAGRAHGDTGHVTAPVAEGGRAPSQSAAGARAALALSPRPAACSEPAVADARRDGAAVRRRGHVGAAAQGGILAVVPGERHESRRGASRSEIVRSRRLGPSRHPLAERLAIAYRRYRAARQQAESFEKEILPDAVESLRLVRIGFERGDAKFDTTAVLQAQQTLAQARLAQVQTLGELWRGVGEIVGLLQFDPPPAEAELGSCAPLRPVAER